MLWVLKSAKMSICEGIKAMPIYYFSRNACTCKACAACLLQVEGTVAGGVLICRQVLNNEECLETGVYINSVISKKDNTASNICGQYT